MNIIFSSKFSSVLYLLSEKTIYMSSVNKWKTKLYPCSSSPCFLSFLHASNSGHCHHFSQLFLLMTWKVKFKSLELRSSWLHCLFWNKSSLPGNWISLDSSSFFLMPLLKLPFAVVKLSLNNPCQFVPAWFSWLTILTQDLWLSPTNFTLK